MATQSSFANLAGYKQNPIRGSFGNSNPMMGKMGMQPQGNLQAIMDLIKRMQTPEPQDELTRTLNELASPAVTGRF